MVDLSNVNVSLSLDKGITKEIRKQQQVQEFIVHQLNIGKGQSATSNLMTIVQDKKESIICMQEPHPSIENMRREYVIHKAVESKAYIYVRDCIKTIVMS